MPRAVVATAYGGPEVLSVVEIDAAAPGPGEVAVDVRAAGVNPADWKRYSGAWGDDPAALPLRIGSEAAGAVVEVGPGVEDLVRGTAVIGYRVDGAYAERLVVPRNALVRKPDALSWEQAAGLLLAGATAVHALTATDVGQGETVLVHAAAGGVGSMVVQLARARGARVIGTASPPNHQYLVALGAEPVAYGPGLADRVRALAPDGVDAAVDAIGTDEAVDVSLELVPDPRRIATLVAMARAREAGIKALGGGPGADPGTAIREAARHELVERADAGELMVHVARTYPLFDVAEAHRQIQHGRLRGKLVLVMP
jgi:NADPH:quinone reductase-like Zn-dependent oxidoreductase